MTVSLSLFSKSKGCFPINDYLNNRIMLLLYLLLSYPDNDYELISIRTLEIPMNFNILFGTFCVHYWMILHLLMQNQWYLYNTLGECVRSLKLDLQRKYMDFSHTLFFPVLIMLFLSTCSEWLISIETFSYPLPIHLPFQTFHFIREMNCGFSILKTFLQENENLHFQL